MARSAAMAAGSSGRRNCSRPRVTRSLRPSCRWSNNGLPPAAPSAQQRAERAGATRMDQVTTARAERPLWRRIVDFPLVTMLIGVAVIMLGIAIAVLVGQFVLPQFPLPAMPSLNREMVFDLLAAPILIILYKLVICRLGEHPRDDLRLSGAV